MKKVLLVLTGLMCLVLGADVLAQGISSGIGGVAAQVTSNISSLARLVTAAAYVAGMAFAVGAIVKFKAHKDNPTQIPISAPIFMLFVAIALIFIPTVFQVGGATLFGQSGTVAGPSGISSFGKKYSGSGG